MSIENANLTSEDNGFDVQMVTNKNIDALFSFINLENNIKSIVFGIAPNK